MGQKQIRDGKFLIRFFNFPVLPSCMLALEPCRVHICSKDIITELDNGFQQNTRHTGRPSRHPRSIPMRRMSSNWAHRHRSPASHAPTGGASVADVLPKGRLPREAPPLTAPSLPCPRGGCFAGREDYHGEAPPHTAPSMPCLRGGCFAEREDYHGEVPPEASPTRRHLDRDFGSGWESATRSHPRLPSVSRSRCLA